jgi:hypothetical protein
MSAYRTTAGTCGIGGTASTCWNASMSRTPSRTCGDVAALCASQFASLARLRRLRCAGSRCPPSPGRRRASDTSGHRARRSTPRRSEAPNGSASRQTKPGVKRRPPHIGARVAARCGRAVGRSVPRSSSAQHHRQVSCSGPVKRMIGLPRRLRCRHERIVLYGTLLQQQVADRSMVGPRAARGLARPAATGRDSVTRP